MWPFGLVAMIPALGAGGPGFKSRNGPYVFVWSDWRLLFYKNYFILVLINESASFASELIVLADKIRTSVKNVFNVELEIEPQTIALDA